MSPRPVLMSLLTCLAMLTGTSAWTAPPEASTKARTDRYGDSLPPGAVARMGSLLFYHGTPCTTLAYSPDGRILAVSGGAGSSFNISSPFEMHNCIRVFDVATGRQLHRLPGHEHTQQVRFSPDGKRLLSISFAGERDRIKIWDVATGKELYRLRGQALSHDGKTALVASPGVDAATIRFVNIATGKELRRIKIPPKKDAFVSQLVAAPDDKTIAGNADDDIYIWDAATGKILHQLAGIKKANVDWLTYSPRGETLAACFNGGAVKLWDSATGKELHQWDKSTGFGKFYSCYSPDGKMLVGAVAYQTIQFWNIKTDEESRRIKTNSSSPTGVALSRDGKKLAWGNGEDCVHIWDLTENEEVHPAGRLPLPIQVVAFSPDGKSLLTSGYRDQPIRSWEIATGKELRQVKRPSSYKPPVLSPSGRLFAVKEHKLRLFDLTTQSEIALRGDLPEDTNLMTFSPDGRTLAVDVKEAAIRLWDTGTGKERRSLGEGKGLRYGLTFTEDGKTLLERIVGEEGPRIRFWEVATGNLLRSVRALGHPAYVALSSDGRLGAGVVKASNEVGWFLDDVRTVIWDLKSGEPLRELRADKARVSHLAFSPDSRSLACVYEVGGVIRLWEVATGQERKRFEGHRQLIHCLAFSADGSLLATGSYDHTALVWDVLGRLDNGLMGQSHLSAEELRVLWGDLAAKDAAVAYRAMCRLLSAKQTVTFMKTQLHPGADLDARQREQVAQWIADLDSPQFETREKAAGELEKLDDRFEPALRATLANKPSLEVRKRIEPILKNLESVPSPQHLQALRAVEVLEHIANAEARELLRALAGGAPSHRLTREAKMSLQRLDRNSSRSGESR